MQKLLQQNHMLFISSLKRNASFPDLVMERAGAEGKWAELQVNK